MAGMPRPSAPGPIAVIAAVTVSLAAFAAPGHAEDVLAEIEACMLAQTPQDSSVQEVLFQSQRKDSDPREIRSEVVWKRFGERRRVLTRVEYPDDLRGSAVLMIERKNAGVDIFTYLPELKKVRRISSKTLRGNLFGSDFTYEDFQLLHGMALEGQTEVLPDREVGGSPAWVIERRPSAESGSGYERVLVTIEKERCLIAGAEMFEPGSDEPRKRLTTDLEAVFEQDGIRLIEKVRLDDLRRDSSTRLELLSVDLDQKVKKRDLDVSALER